VLGRLASVRVDGAVGEVNFKDETKRVGGMVGLMEARAAARGNQGRGFCGHPQKWCRNGRCQGRGAFGGVGRNWGWEDVIEVGQGGRRESSIGRQG